MTRSRSIRVLAFEAVDTLVQRRVIYPATGPKRGIAENVLLRALSEGLLEREAALVVTRMAMEALRPFAERFAMLDKIHITGSQPIGVQPDEVVKAREALLLIRRAYTHTVGVELLEALRRAVAKLEEVDPKAVGQVYDQLGGNVICEK